MPSAGLNWGEGTALTLFAAAALAAEASLTTEGLLSILFLRTLFPAKDVEG
jgi:hypothetical protein